MAAKKSALEKRVFTVSEANATLPLVKAIVRDIMELARDLREREERLNRAGSSKKSAFLEAYQEEVRLAQAGFERDQERLQEYEQELKDLGVELKDYFTGLIDFPCLLDNREVYLCWRYDEPEVSYWHELKAGFSGRQRIRANTFKS
jgi:hypothetical protein